VNTTTATYEAVGSATATRANAAPETARHARPHGSVATSVTGIGTGIGTEAPRRTAAPFRKLRFARAALLAAAASLGTHATIPARATTSGNFSDSDAAVPPAAAAAPTPSTPAAPSATPAASSAVAPSASAEDYLNLFPPVALVPLAGALEIGLPPTAADDTADPWDLLGSPGVLADFDALKARTSSNIYNSVSTGPGDYVTLTIGASLLSTDSTATLSGNIGTTASGTIDPSHGYIRLIKTGSGTIRLSGANNFRSNDPSATVIISDGTLEVADFGAPGTYGPLGLNSSASTVHIETAGRLHYTGTGSSVFDYTLTSTGGGTFAVGVGDDANNPSTVLVSHVTDGSTLSKTGQGTLIFGNTGSSLANGSGNIGVGKNIQNGGLSDTGTLASLTISGGTVVLARSTDSIISSSGTITVAAGGILKLGSTAEGNTAHDQIAGTLALNGGVFDLTGQTETLTTFTISQGGTITTGVADSTGAPVTTRAELTFSSGTLAKDTTGILTLEGVKIGGNVNASVAGNILLQTLSTDSTTFAPEIAGTLTISNPASRLVFSSRDTGGAAAENAKNYTYEPTFLDFSTAVIAAANIDKNSSGTLVLSGDNSAAYAGNINVNGGILQLFTNFSSASVTVGNNATLELRANVSSYASVNNVTLNNGGALVAAGGIIGGLLTFNGAVTVTPIKPVSGNATSAYQIVRNSGATVSVDVSSLDLSTVIVGDRIEVLFYSASSLSSDILDTTTSLLNSNWKVIGQTNLNFRLRLKADDTSSSKLIWLEATKLAPVLRWAVTSSPPQQSIWSTDNESLTNWANITDSTPAYELISYVATVGVFFGDDDGNTPTPAAIPAFARTIAIPADIDLTRNDDISSGVEVNASTGDYTFTGSGKITGSAATLTKRGTSKLTLSNDNSFGGQISITGGTVIVAGSLGNAGTGDAATTFTHTGAIYLGDATDTGHITFDQTTTHGTTPASIAKQIITGAVTGAGTVTKNNPNTLEFTAAVNIGGLTVAAGTAAFTTTTAGTTALGAVSLGATLPADTYSTGVLTLGGVANYTLASLASVAGTLDLTTTGTVTIGDSTDGAGTVAFAGTANTLQGSAALVWKSSKTLTLEKASTFSGALSITGGGKVSIGGNAAALGGTADITLATTDPLVPSTFDFAGTDTTATFSLSRSLKGTGAFTKTGAGILSFSGATDSGVATAISGGTFIKTNSAATLSGAVKLSGAGTRFVAQEGTIASLETLSGVGNSPTVALTGASITTLKLASGATLENASVASVISALTFAGTPLLPDDAPTVTVKPTTTTAVPSVTALTRDADVTVAFDISTLLANGLTVGGQYNLFKNISNISGFAADIAAEDGLLDADFWKLNGIEGYAGGSFSLLAVETSGVHNIVLAVHSLSRAVYWAVTDGTTTADWNSTDPSWKRDDGFTTVFHAGNTAYFTDTDTGAAGGAAITAIAVNIPADVAPGAVVVNNNTRDYVFDTDASGKITGSATTLTKEGTRKLTINNENSYAGGTSVKAGELVAGHAKALGSGDVALYGDATLTLDAAAVGTTAAAGATPGFANTLTIDGTTATATTPAKLNVPAAGKYFNAPLKGAGTLSLIGPGVGLTADLDGAVNLGAASPLFTGTLAAASQDVFVFTAGGDWKGTTVLLSEGYADGYSLNFEQDTTLAAVGSDGAGVVNIAAAKKLALAGSGLSYSGAGTTPFNINGDTGSVLTSAAANGVLTLTNSNTNTAAPLVLNVAVTDNGTTKVKLATSGAGTKVLTVPSTFTGGIEVGGGILDVRAKLANSVYDITVKNTGTLLLNSDTAVFALPTATVNPRITVETGGQVTAAKTLTFGALTLAGGTITAATSDGVVLKGAVTTDATATTVSELAASSGGFFRLGAGSTQGTIFNIADSEIATDLRISAPLADRLNDAGDATLASQILKNGTGTLALAGANTFTGAISVSAGALSLVDGGSLGGGDFGATITLTGAGASLVFAQDNAQTISGLISGDGSVVVQSGGVTTLATTNTFGGGLFVKSGILSAPDENALGATGAGAASVVLGDTSGTTGTLRLTSGSLTRDVSLAANGGGAFDFGAAGGTVSGLISGGGSLAKTGAGLVALTNANTFTGALAVRQGVLEISGAGLLGASAASPGVGDYSQNISLETAGSVLDLQPAAGNTQILSGAVSGLGTLVIDGAAALAPSGAGIVVVNGAVSAKTEIRGGVLAGVGVLENPEIWAGATIAPGDGTWGDIGTLTLGTASSTVNFYSITLRLDVSGNKRDSDLVRVLGTAIFSGANTFDLCLDGKNAAGFENNATYTVAEAGSSLSYSPAALALAEYSYKGVSLGNSSRISAEASVAADGKRLLLTTHMAGGYSLIWDGQPGQTGWESVSATSGTGNFYWLYYGAATPTREFFQNGDCATFPDSPTVEKNIDVAPAGVIAGYVNVNGSGYEFTGGAIVGLAPAAGVEYEPGATPTDTLTVAAGVSVAFRNSRVDFANISIGADAQVIFGGAAQPTIVVSDSPLQIATGAALTFETGANLSGLKGIAFSGSTGSADVRFDIAGTVELTAPLSGALNLTKSSGGRVALLGENTTTGSVAINDGTLAFGSAHSFDSVSGVAVAADAALEFAFSQNAGGYIVANISGAGGVTATGAGEAVFNSPKSYTGTTVVDGGKLRLAVTGALPASAEVSALGGGLLTLAAPDALPDATVTISGGASIAATSPSAGQHLGSLVLAGAADAGGAAATADFHGAALTLARGGSFGIAAANLGAFTLSSGVLALVAEDALASATAVTISGGIVNTATSQTLHNLNAAEGTAIVAGDGTTLSIESSAGFAGVITGNIEGRDVALVFAGEGKHSLARPSRHTGETRIIGGELELADVDALPVTPVINVETGGKLTATANQIFVKLNIAEGASADFGTADATAKTGGEIAGTFAGGDFKIETGTLLLSGVDAIAGAKSVTVAAAPIGAPVLISATADQKFQKLKILENAVFTLATDVTAEIASGEIYSALDAGAGARIIKTDDGTGDHGVLRLYPTSASQSETIVLAGTLTIRDDAALGGGKNTLDGKDAAGNIIATVRFEGETSAADWSLGESGGAFEVSGRFLYNGSLDGSGDFLKKGAGELTLANPSQHTGLTTVKGGALELTQADSLLASTGLRLEGGNARARAAQTLANLDIAKNSDFSLIAAADGTPYAHNLTIGGGKITGSITGVENLTLDTIPGGTGELDLVAATGAKPLRLDGYLNINAGVLTLRSDKLGPSLIAKNLSFGENAALNVIGDYTGDLYLDSEGRLTSRPLVLIQTTEPITNFPRDYHATGVFGEGEEQREFPDFMSVQLSFGDYDCAVVARAGLVWYDAHTDASGTLLDRAHGTFTVTEDFTLEARMSDRSGNFLPSVWDGKTLTKAGAAKLTLTADQTYSGATRVTEGTLEVKGVLGWVQTALSVTPAGDYAGDIILGVGEAVADIVLDQVNRQILRGDIRGTGNFTKSGVGVLTVAGNTAISGVLSVNGGAQAVFQGNANAGEISVAGTATFDTATANVLRVSNRGTAEFAGTVNVGDAILEGATVFRADTTVRNAFTLDAPTIALGAGVTLTLQSGGTIATDIALAPPPAGTAPTTEQARWTLRNAGALDARSLAGNLVNTGIATLSGGIGGDVVNSGELLNVAGDIGGTVRNNTGFFSLRGHVGGDFENAYGATLFLDNEPSRRQELSGDLRNDGWVIFKNLGQVLTAQNLRNLTPGGVGYYTLDADAGTPLLSDHILLADNGVVEGRHVFSVTLQNPTAATKDTAIALVRGKDISFSGATLSLSGGPLEAGIVALDFAPGTGTLVATGASTAAREGLRNSSGVMALRWLAQLDNVNKRLGDLRLANSAYANAATTPAAAKLANTEFLPPEKIPNESFWVRAYALRSNVDLSGADTPAFHEYEYGADVGADHTFRIGSEQQLSLGAFAGYMFARRGGGSGLGGKSESDAPSAGLYALWQHKSGWYLDGVFKAQRFDNKMITKDGDASFENTAAGASLELGYEWTFKSGWSLTPSAQFAFTHLWSVDYLTPGGSVEVESAGADALRYSVSLRLAKDWDVGSAGLLQTSLRLGYEEQNSYGGAVAMRGAGAPNWERWRPGLDGSRYSAALGLAWQFTKNQQFHFEYEYTTGDRYDTPWSLNAGWRIRF
jgi:outer membrane autotransporter protein